MNKVSINTEKWIQVYKDEGETEGVVKFLTAQYEKPSNPTEAPYYIKLT